MPTGAWLNSKHNSWWSADPRATAPRVRDDQPTHLPAAYTGEKEAAGFWELEMELACLQIKKKNKK